MQSPLFESYGQGGVPSICNNESEPSSDEEVEDLMIDNEYYEEGEDFDYARYGGGTTSFDEIFHSDEERVFLDSLGRPLRTHTPNMQRMVVKTELGGHNSHQDVSGQMKANFNQAANSVK